MNRKSLMISEAAHATICGLSETHGLNQPTVVAALLEAVDPDRLGLELQRAVERRRRARGATAARRRRLEEAFGGLDDDALERLIAGLRADAPGLQ